MAVSLFLKFGHPIDGFSIAEIVEHLASDDFIQKVVGVNEERAQVFFIGRMSETCPTQNLAIATGPNLQFKIVMHLRYSGICIAEYNYGNNWNRPEKSVAKELRIFYANFFDLAKHHM